jgi:hypothetical protein
VKMSPRFRTLFASPALSPGWMLAWSLRLGALYLIVELLGLRRYAAILSGTFGPGGQLVSTFLGVFFLVSYFAFVLAAPALLVGGAIAWGAGRLAGRTNTR